MFHSSLVDWCHGETDWLVMVVWSVSDVLTTFELFAFHFVGPKSPIRWGASRTGRKMKLACTQIDTVHMAHFYQSELQPLISIRWVGVRYVIGVSVRTPNEGTAHRMWFGANHSGLFVRPCMPIDIENIMEHLSRRRSTVVSAMCRMGLESWSTGFCCNAWAIERVSLRL